MPKVVDHEARRLEIARAAWRGIGESGIDGVTLRAIAEEAGFTTGALTHYFRSKEDLLLTALDLVVEANVARLRGHAPTDVEGLLQTLDEVLPTTGDRVLEWRVWISFWARAIADTRLAEKQRTLYGIWASILDEALAALQRADAIRHDADRVAIGAQILVMVDGLGLQACLDPAAWPPVRQRSHLRRQVEMLLRGAPRMS